MKERLGLGIFTSVILIFVIFISSICFAATIQVTINANGDDPYQVFSKALGTGVDGVQSGHIFNVAAPTFVSPTAKAFEFVLHNTGDFDNANMDRQRNEVKVNGSSPDNLKATNGSTFTYKWKFKLDSNWPPHKRFCHIFQLKADAGDSGAPILTFTTTTNELDFNHNSIGKDMSTETTLAKTSLTNVEGVWVEATVTCINKDNGHVAMTLKRVDNGAILMTYDGNQDMFRTGANFNRPKWGIYRGLFDGIKEARIQFADIQIIK